MKRFTMASALEQIEAVVTRQVRRDISRLAAFATGNLGRAARSIAETERPHIGIVTGFYIKHAEPPSPETDGLIGMAQLAAGFRAAGFEVTIITDAPCAKAVWAVVDALPLAVNLEVVSVSEQAVLRLRGYLAALDSPITHLIAIERVSPGPDEKPHREHGWDMSRETAPLHLLFKAPSWQRPWITIGIGDGGNEIGMGSLPPEIVATNIPNGDIIAATTPADYLIVAGVSNWGAYGLLGSVANLRADIRADLLRHFDGQHEHEFLTAAVLTGQAIDDSRVDRLGKPQMSVDRVPVDEHAALVEEIRALALR
jgi:hypothetical protein